MITTYEFGNPEADVVLLQLTGEHELAGLENEIQEIRKRTSSGEWDFRFIAAKVENWNDELSPWKAPAVFKDEDFGGGAAKTLERILALCTDPSKTYYIGGYSLAGLFALWAAYQTDRFSGVAAASPSVWFPGFSDYMREHRMKTGTVYLSLGDREEKTRNPVMAQVGACIREACSWMLEQGINCTLEWNQGNHFQEPDVRTAKAFAWVIENQSMTTIWCGYYDGNQKSKRVQEKLGFVFHHTCNEVPVPLLNEVRIGHTNIMTKERWEEKKKLK